MWRGCWPQHDPHMAQAAGSPSIHLPDLELKSRHLKRYHTFAFDLWFLCQIFCFAHQNTIFHTFLWCRNIFVNITSFKWTFPSSDMSILFNWSQQNTGGQKDLVLIDVAATLVVLSSRHRFMLLEFRARGIYLEPVGYIWSSRQMQTGLAYSPGHVRDCIRGRQRYGNISYVLTLEILE